MAKKTVPKYVLRLLERRRKLSLALMSVCNQIDEYCQKIGVDFSDPDACLQSDIRIYCEFDAGYRSTLSVIEKTLAIKNRQS